MRVSIDEPAARNATAGRQTAPTYALRSAFALLPGRALVATRTPTMRPLPDTLRPYLTDLLVATAGLVGAVGTGVPLFAPDATGDAAWLHALFLFCTAVMLVGTARFLVRTMDIPEPADNTADGHDAPAHARVRRDEAGGTKE